MNSLPNSGRRRLHEIEFGANFCSLVSFAIPSPRAWVGVKEAPERKKISRAIRQAAGTRANAMLTTCPQIRQALAKTDYDFLSKRASRGAQRRVRRDRRGIALNYLAALRGDFQGLLRMARVIAVLSPDVAAAHEFERLRLTAKFAWQYQMIRWKLTVGFAPLPQLDGLSELVSGLSVSNGSGRSKSSGSAPRFAAELASSMDRRGMSAV